MDGRRVALRVEVFGRVQGVGYRHFARGAARRHAVEGWVRNRRDGAVEAHLEGAPEAVAALLEELARGPAFAEVTRVERREVPPEDVHGFEVLPTV